MSEKANYTNQENKIRKEIPEEWQKKMNEEFNRIQKEGLDAESFEKSLKEDEIDVTNKVPEGIPIIKENEPNAGNEKMFADMLNNFNNTISSNNEKIFNDTKREDENLLGINNIDGTGAKNITYETKADLGEMNVATELEKKEKKVNIENNKEEKSKQPEEIINMDKLEVNENIVNENNSLNITSNDFLNNNFNKDSELPEMEKTFNDDEEVKVEEKEIIKETDYSSPQSFLDSIHIDLNQVEIIDPIPMNDMQSFEFILNSKSKTQIIAVQSGYKAFMEGLNYDEMTSLTNSSLDDYSSRLLLLQIIHSKINTTSIGKLTFDNWTKYTSYHDFESFLFGSYLESFPGTTKFSVRCGHCQKSVDADINNDTLVRGKNNNTDERIREISSLGDTRALLKDSLVYKKKRIVLPDSKIIVDIKIPTVRKYLDLMGSLNPQSRQKLSNILSIMFYVDSMYMLDIRESMQKKKPKYFIINNNDRIARTIAKLNFNDSKFFLDTINEYMDLYKTEYKIKSFICPHCKKQLGDIPVDLEVLLFTQILQLS